MADEKPRAPRARKKGTAAEPVGGKPTAKPAAKKKPAARASAPVAVHPGDVAVRAYLLWEQGEPGDATEHWLRAEHELAAA